MKQSVIVRLALAVVVLSAMTIGVVAGDEGWRWRAMAGVLIPSAIVLAALWAVNRR